MKRAINSIYLVCRSIEFNSIQVRSIKLSHYSFLIIVSLSILTSFSWANLKSLYASHGATRTVMMNLSASFTFSFHNEFLNASELINRQPEDQTFFLFNWNVEALFVILQRKVCSIINASIIVIYQLQSRKYGTYNSHFFEGILSAWTSILPESSFISAYLNIFMEVTSAYVTLHGKTGKKVNARAR